jgi:hypothetical protein
VAAAGPSLQSRISTPTKGEYVICTSMPFVAQVDWGPRL